LETLDDLIEQKKQSCKMKALIWKYILKDSGQEAKSANKAVHYDGGLDLSSAP
jgi:hypothetical protein